MASSEGTISLVEARAREREAGIEGIEIEAEAEAEAGAEAEGITTEAGLGGKGADLG